MYNTRAFSDPTYLFVEVIDLKKLKGKPFFIAYTVEKIIFLSFQTKPEEIKEHMIHLFENSQRDFIFCISEEFLDLHTNESFELSDFLYPCEAKYEILDDLDMDWLQSVLAVDDFRIPEDFFINEKRNEIQQCIYSYLETCKLKAHEEII